MSETSAEKTVLIDVVSDVMCPWCYIGKRRLEAALERTPYQLQVHWRPFQLDATLPPEGKDRKAYLEEKFGSPEKASEFTRMFPRRANWKISRSISTRSPFRRTRSTRTG